MRKALLILKTRCRVDPENIGEMHDLVEMIRSRTVVVCTPDKCRGVAVRVGDKIITSLFLVSNHRMVRVVGPNGEVSQAVVVARDEENFLAKLREVDFGSKVFSEGKHNNWKVAKPMGIGEALLTINADNSRTPAIEVSAMLYVTKISELKARDDFWKIDSSKPKGVVGSGVWDLEGRFVGLAIGRMIPPPDKLLLAAMTTVQMKFQPMLTENGIDALRKSFVAFPRVYVAPAEKVLDLVETN